MAESEIIVSTEVLEDLQHGLKRYRAFLLDHLREVKAEMRRLRENLEESRRDAANHVYSCQAAIDAADEEEDTSSLYDDLSEAEQQLHQVQRMQRRMDELAGDYQREAVRMHKIADEHLPKSCALVEKKHDAMRNLLGLQSDGMGVLTGFIGTGIQMMAELTGAAIDAGAELTDSAMSAVAGLLDFTSKPIPTGFQWMKLDEVKLHEILAEVKSAADYRPHATYDTMIKGLETLRENVLPTIASHGYAADSFLFSRMDRKAGVAYEDGTQRVYDAFFGEDAIAVQLDPSTGKFDVINGRHRIKAALDAGWLAVPVKTPRKTIS